VLYERPPAVPELSVRPPFRAAPLLVSGTDALRDEEYVYQDHLFDDRGANTLPATGTQRDPNLSVGPSAGDVLYPTAARFAGNAADLVEFRVRPTSRQLRYRVTLNAARDAGTAAVGIGIDLDRSGGAAVAWPHDAGLTSPGLDAFITAWGTGGDVALRSPGSATLDRVVPLPAGAVTMDVEANQMTIDVPRSLPAMDPGRRTWRHVLGVGLWGGRDFLAVPSGTRADADTPASGSSLRPAPAIFNLGFRFDERQSLLGLPEDDTLPGSGGWFDAGQARALAEGTSGRFFADVDFGAMAAGRDRWLHAPGRDQARIHPSDAPVHEGFDAGRTPSYGGRLQPYMLHLPPASSRRPGLVMAMHGSSATHTQYSAISPTYLRQLGDERNSLVAVPLGRDSRGAGTEREFFEVWADVAHRFDVDPRKVVLSGYSAGGYETFVRATRWPDLFARAFAIVGAARLLDGGVPGDATNYIPMLGNLRWVPMLAWNQVVDELAPYVGIRLGQLELDRLGLRSQVWTFPVGEHFTPGALDRWDGARDWVGDAEVHGDPSRVDYAIAPVTWRPEDGLVADHAYWTSGLRLRDARALDGTSTARGYLTAISRAFGQGDPITRRVLGAYPGPPTPATIDGTDWAGIERQPARNALDLDLRNLSRVEVDGRRARLDGERPLEVTVVSDGRATVSVVLPLPAGTTATRIAGTGGTASAGRRRVVLHVAAGTSRYRLSPPARAARRCTSRRTITLRLPSRVRGRRVESARVRVGARAPRTYRRRKVRISLAGSPAGRVTVRISLRLRGGRRVVQVRRYRTCARRAPRPGAP
jgi:hypothetical protein